MPFIPHTDDDTREMLEAIGAAEIEIELAEGLTAEFYGSLWDGVDPAQREALGDLVVQTLGSAAPGIGQSVVARQVLTPPDIEADFGISGGHPLHLERARLLFESMGITAHPSPTSTELDAIPWKTRSLLTAREAVGIIWIGLEELGVPYEWTLPLSRWVYGSATMLGTN